MHQKGGHENMAQQYKFQSFRDLLTFLQVWEDERKQAFPSSPWTPWQVEVEGEFLSITDALEKLSPETTNAPGTFEGGWRNDEFGHRFFLENGESVFIRGAFYQPLEA